MEDYISREAAIEIAEKYGLTAGSTLDSVSLLRGGDAIDCG